MHFCVQQRGSVEALQEGEVHKSGTLQKGNTLTVPQQRTIQHVQDFKVAKYLCLMSLVFSNKHAEGPIAQTLGELTADVTKHVRVSELDVMIHFSL
jgi:hypothetical protein